MKIALDTNTYSAFMTGEKRAVELLRRADVIGFPVPVLAELRFGFMSGDRGRQNEGSLVKFLDSSRVRVLNCDEQTTFYYSQLKLQLKKQGTPIPIIDVWIAALVIQHSMELFTYDRDFDQLPQLARV